MKLSLLVAGALLIVPAAAPAMPVQTFLAKANALKSRGPLALFSGDLKLLTNQIKADFAQLRSERLAAQAAHRPTAFCPPAPGVKLTDKDILGAMQAIPAASRPVTDTRDVLRAYMAQRFPCPR
jgi:hypothetical protein